jgi:hypothetical protein
MNMQALAAISLTLLAGCAARAPALQCGDPGAVAPANVGGAAFVNDLTGRLAGPDRENVIEEAIATIHQREPGLSIDAITDILIAADCPNALSKPYHDANADRARIAAFRAQVDQIIGHWSREAAPPLELENIARP